MIIIGKYEPSESIKGQTRIKKMVKQKGDERGRKKI